MNRIGNTPLTWAHLNPKPSGYDPVLFLIALPGESVEGSGDEVYASTLKNDDTIIISINNPSSELLDLVVFYKHGWMIKMPKSIHRSWVNFELHEVSN